MVGQHRSTQRLAHRPRPAEEDKVRRRLRAIARAHPRWGWKTAHVILRREGHTINRKRTRRLWRDEGLRRPAPCRRKRRRPPGGGPLLRAERPNHVWAIDFQFDETADRRRIKLCNIVDEHTREALAMRVARTCTAEDVITIIEGLVAERGAPEHLRMDNFAAETWLVMNQLMGSPRWVW
ncbi:MAG: DDE-type integrase/transposase/recombinase [Acidimicrobiales bacterium]|nr:DDE-type integrase/transposase/recombinase [Acidimicrobiales bacterium]